MATFLEELWNSIFTPGPTPPLLLATNATFAALQLILLILFIATYSLHFVVLSFLCGGLWYAINWFAKEVQVAQRAEAEEKGMGERLKGREDSSVVWVRDDKGAETDGAAAGGDEMDSEEQDTETELDDGKSGEGLRRGRQKVEEKTPTMEASTSGFEKVSTKQSILASRSMGGAGKEAPKDMKGAGGGGEDVKKRRSMAESTGSLSTDSEWEKVEDDR